MDALVGGGELQRVERAPIGRQREPPFPSSPPGKWGAHLHPRAGDTGEQSRETERRGLRWVAAVDNGPCIGTKRGRLSWAQYDLRKDLDSLSSEEKRRKRIFARETRGRE